MLTSPIQTKNHLIDCGSDPVMRGRGKQKEKIFYIYSGSTRRAAMHPAHQSNSLITAGDWCKPVKPLEQQKKKKKEKDRH